MDICGEHGADIAYSGRDCPACADIEDIRDEHSREIRSLEDDHQSEIDDLQSEIDRLQNHIDEMRTE